MSEKNILSQEEIEALLNFSEQQDFSFTKAELETVVVVTVELAKTKMTLEHLISLQSNDLLALDKTLGASLDLSIKGEIIAQGQVKLDKNNKFFLQLNAIVDQGDRLQQIIQE